MDLFHKQVNVEKGPYGQELRPSDPPTRARLPRPPNRLIIGPRRRLQSDAHVGREMAGAAARSNLHF